MKHQRTILVIAAATFLQCMAALCAWRVPLLPLCMLNAGMTHTAMKQLPETLVAAALLDALWCHELPTQVIAVLLVAGLSSSLSRIGAVSSWLAMALAGAAVGVVDGCVMILLRNGTLLSGAWRLLLGEMLIAAVLAPIVTAALDWFLRKPAYWHGTRRMFEDQEG